MLLIDYFPERAAKMSEALKNAAQAAGAEYIRFGEGGAERLADADVIAAASPNRIDSDLIEKATRLSGIITPGSGTDNVDIQAATDAGVLIAHGPVEENWIGMAEATVMMILAATFDLPGAISQMQTGSPKKSRMLKGKTVGLLGLGRIGLAVAERLQAFGVRLISTPSRRGSPKDVQGIEMLSFEDVLAQSDILSIHMALTPETHHIIDAAALARMKSDAVLINTARGGLVDEDALVATLNAGRLRCAAFDVFETEPLPQDHALRNAPRTILTPHCVGMTEEGGAALIKHLGDNATALLTGLQPIYVRNPEVLDTWKARRRET